MADVAPNPAREAADTSEKTFRAYTAEQGTAYARNRRGYHPALYKLILQHHLNSNGLLHSLVDLGCGPGTATRELSPYFENALGLDPSAGMIATARDMGGITSIDTPVRFEVGSAEDLGSDLNPTVADGSVDLIAAATAAHWFDMDRFWARAVRVLRPGGTVAFWTGSSIVIHRDMPNALAIQKAIADLKEEHLRPYMERGNLVGQGLYVDLPLPWTVAEPVDGFDRESFYRQQWNLSDATDAAGGFFQGKDAMTLDMLEMAAGTMSPVTRWREAHPEAVGEKDVVRIMRRTIEKLLHEAGVDPGKEFIMGGISGVLLMVKKKMETQTAGSI
ncbi:S-adenosylmethionine-dependent methyltransferase CRG1 like protein [Verticillium longisporum]